MWFSSSCVSRLSQLTQIVGNFLAIIIPDRRDKMLVIVYLEPSWKFHRPNDSHEPAATFYRSLIDSEKMIARSDQKSVWWKSRILKANPLSTALDLHNVLTDSSLERAKFSPILDFLVDWFGVRFLKISDIASCDGLFWCWSIELMLMVLMDSESSDFSGERPKSWGVSDDLRNQRMMSGDQAKKSGMR